MQDDHYEGAILEEIRDQNKAILEGLAPLLPMSRVVDQLKEDVAELKIDVKAIKAVITDHSGQLNNHETRITQLEAV